jgi:hypothetical protein
MLLGIVFAGWFALAQKASLTCSNIATAQTKPVSGPGATVAVLKVSTADDHSKDSHLCMADYQLVITQSSADKPTTVDLLSSDDEWGRGLAIQLSGFSHDGKRILGMFSEGIATPMQQVFEYNTDDGLVRSFDLPKLAARLTTKKCLMNTQIIGTSENDAIVIQLRSGKYCAHTTRWLLNSQKGPLRRVPKRASVLELYGASSDNR